jgi:4-hydroxybenzoyl-CoA reductase subunit beta
MMRLPKFRYYAPRTVREAVAIRADAGPESAFVAGGTDLYPNMKRRQQTPKVVIGISRIPALTRIRFRPEGAAIGSAVLLSAVETHRRVRRDYPGLVAAIEAISTPPLRNMGTLGGNLLLDTRCNYYDQNYEWRKAIQFCLKKDGDICWVAPGSPTCLAVQSADSVPILIALKARAVLESASGRREVAVEDLYKNDGIDYLTKRPEELLTEILSPAGRVAGSYRKLRRQLSDFPVLCVGAAIRRRWPCRRGAWSSAGRFGAGPADRSEPSCGRPSMASIAAAPEASAGPSRPMTTPTSVSGASRARRSCSRRSADSPG